MFIFFRIELPLSIIESLHVQKIWSTDMNMLHDFNV